MTSEKGNDGISRLIKNTGLLYVLTFSSQIINLLLIPYQTRVLGSEAYGILSLAVSMSLIMSVYLDFGFILSATERVVKLVGDKKGLASLLGDVAFLKAMIAIPAGITVGVLVVCVPPFCNNKHLFVLYALAYIVNAFLPDFFYRGHEDMRVITIRTVLIKVGSALPVFALLHDPEDIWVVPALLLFGNFCAVVFSYFDIRLRYGITKLTCHPREALSLLKSSLGFFISRFSSVFYQSLNTVLLGFVFPGQAVVGYYGAAEKFLSLARTASSPVADSLYPYMIRTKNYKLCIRILAVSTPVIFLLALLAGIFAEPLCVIAFGEGFEGSAELLRCLLPAIAVIFPTYILCFPMLVPMGLSSYANRSNVVGAVVQLVLLVILFATDSFSAVRLCLLASISEVSVFLFRLWAVFTHRNRMRSGFSMLCDANQS